MDNSTKDFLNVRTSSLRINLHLAIIFTCLLFSFTLINANEFKRLQKVSSETKWNKMNLQIFFCLVTEITSCWVMPLNVKLSMWKKKIIGTNSFGESLYELGPTKNKKQIGQQLIVLTCLINDAMIWCQMNI